MRGTMHRDQIGEGICQGRSGLTQCCWKCSSVCFLNMVLGKSLHWRHQNEDGGFGSLEPVSAPPHLWLLAAARILWRETDTNHVQSMKGYLSRSQDDTGMWAAVLPQNNEFPHAPWWHWEPGVEQQWMFNPSVELAAYLIHWSEPKSSEAQRGWKTVRLATARLMSCTEMDMHEINSFLSMKELLEFRTEEFTEKTGYSLRDFERKLAELVEAAVETDIAQWVHGYKALPLTFVQHPDSFLCDVLGNLVAKNLDFYIE